jgi:hypothetical protein
MAPVFALHFVSPRKGKDRPFSPKARIAVKAFSQDTADGPPFIAAGASVKEIDDAIDALIKDLKRVRKDARRRFDEHEKVFAKTKRKK